MNLNERAVGLCEQFVDNAAEMRVAVSSRDDATRIIDCGVNVVGGLKAGLAMAEVCMSGLGSVSLVPGGADLWPGPAVQVRTDQPVAACMASQYAGWQIAGGGYFAMGSGPMRAARGREELFNSIGFREEASHAVGVLESGELPPAEVCSEIAQQCRVESHCLTLLVAPTSSIAGTIQVVARSIETCLHKMHELGFDLSQVESGFGVAPLPPVAADDLVGIGRTNDAVLYGGEVTLWLRAEDATLEELGMQIPSSSSADHGQPFGQVFEKYDHDFYKIDPLLFSPAQVTLINLETGRTFRFGELCPDVIRQSFSE
ncbi:MAG: methenyltetrahydromethanopterin cyclohydrolase [Planctomycetes bacterium]|nr:methenyltetrahydromethanopterin cyclohydrolase [Planctomycetota bacterium]MBL7040170.1 methenyltetrahydromethanopterin cyclohydrolase [Pirellulaceae bacterium]